jgi:serine/threonine protein phosphatase 1
VARTFAVGDIHGDLDALERAFGRLPALDAGDTIVFLGDYIDRGPNSAEVVRFVRRLSNEKRSKVVALRGNHEDAWLRVIQTGWPEFVMPPGNGCLAALRSFVGTPDDATAEPEAEELEALLRGSFFPRDVVEWMRGLPHWYEDEHAIYVHAGLPRQGDRFLHPSQVVNPAELLWIRTKDFVRSYRGKRVVFGHTPTSFLPQELSSYTPDDPTDMFLGPSVVGTDTGCGTGGFLTAVELPAVRVYESR